MGAASVGFPSKELKMNTQQLIFGNTKLEENTLW